MIIDQEFKSLNRKLNESEYKKLEASIIQEGVRDPLVLWNEILIDGHNRLDIATKHNISYSTINNNDLADREEVKTWIINNQLGRRNLTPNEVSYYRGKLYESLKRQGERSDITSGQNVHKSTSEEMAEKYGVSEKTIRRDAEFSKAVDRVEAEAGIDIKDAILSGKANIPKKNVEDVIKIKQEAPELMPKLESGEMTAHEAVKIIKKDKRDKQIQEQIKEIEQNDFTPPTKKYDVIVVDPPWPYGTKYDPNGRRAANPYPEMSLDDIKAIELPASDDCVLWLWTTHKFMRYSFDILDAWGFRDVAIITWVKDRMGLGTHIRSQSEFCIMALRGKPTINLTNQTTVVNGKLKEHSRKPDEFYEMVNSLCVGYKLDYFSREQREGWDQYGNDTNRF
jgi:N6-adenosine-specific RNA methylase IME4